MRMSQTFMSTSRVETLPRTRVVDPLDDPSWDERVNQLPGATFFHSSSWAAVLKNTYGFRPCYFTQEHDNRLEALLPMLEVDSWLTGRRGISLPFTDACGPACEDASSFRSLYKTAVRHGSVRQWKYLECRGGKELLSEATPSTSYVNHLLPLVPDIGKLHRAYAESVRRAIRKAEKSQVTIEFSRELHAIKVFYSLLCLTRKRHGVPPQPLRFFEQIHKNVMLAGKGWVVLARHLGRPIAAGIFFHFGKQAFFKFGASDKQNQQLRGNNLVMSRAIEWYAQNGFTSFDFGRTAPHNQGLRHFKLGWGAIERTVDYMRFNLRTGEYLTASTEASLRIFHHLPIPLSRLVGSMLYRHVA